MIIGLGPAWPSQIHSFGEIPLETQSCQCQQISRPNSFITLTQHEYADPLISLADLC